MAKQWQLSATGWQIEYTSSGYKLSGHLRWEVGKWCGGAVVVPDTQDGRAGGMAMIEAREDIQDAMAAVEELMESLCAKLRDAPCGDP